MSLRDIHTGPRDSCRSSKSIAHDPGRIKGATDFSSLPYHGIDSTSLKIFQNVAQVVCELPGSGVSSLEQTRPTCGSLMSSDEGNKTPGNVE